MADRTPASGKKGLASPHGPALDHFEIRWRCREGAELESAPDGSVLLSVDGYDPVPYPVPPVLGRRLLRLNTGISEVVIGRGIVDPVGAARLYRVMYELRDAGLLVAELYGEGRRLATVRPFEARSAMAEAAAPPPAGERLRLSRFAWVYRQGRHWILESTEEQRDVLIEDSAVLVWLHEAPTEDLALGTLRFQVLNLLARLGFLESREDEEEPPRTMWELHDRLFHRRSRSFRNMRPFGATCRFVPGTGQGGGIGAVTGHADATGPVNAVGRDGDSGQGRVECPPVMTEGYAGDVIELPVPDLKDSRPLAEVLDSRRSGYVMGDSPVSLAEVAALFYGVARITGRAEDGNLRRTYPSGGSLHELEFYLAVRECRGLAAGFYHYRSDAHALTHLAGGDADEAAAGMIEDCAIAWYRPDGPPQCLAVIASRLPRVAWKYEGLAYRISLLSSGAALYNFCLVATDLGLSGSIVGAVRPDLFNLATGQSSWKETSIGEFGFGSRPIEA